MYPTIKEQSTLTNKIGNLKMKKYLSVCVFILCLNIVLTPQTFEARDSSRQINIPNNHGTVNINVTQNVSSQNNTKITQSSVKKNYHFIESDTFFSERPNFNSWNRVTCEIKFYFKDDSLINNFSKILVKVEEKADSNKILKLQEFFFPQKGLNSISVPLRNVKPPFWVTCAVILNTDEEKEVINAYYKKYMQINW